MTQATLPPLPDRALSVCIVGAGAIGGTIAARLAQIAGGPEVSEVSVIARGATLAAIREHGLRLRQPDGTMIQVPVKATDDPDDLPPQDLVITALKGHQIHPMAGKLARLMAPGARMLPVVNGLPWWYPVSDGQGGTKGAEEVDPGGRLWSLIGPERAIGCIAVIGVSQPEPGLVEIGVDGYFDLGRMPGQDGADVARVTALLRAAGLSIENSEAFGSSLWRKLVNNGCTNSVCAISLTPMNEMVAIPELAAFSAGIAQEIIDTAHAEGIALDYDIAGRQAQVRDGAPFRPSTLQDVEAGRPLEVEPIFGAALAVARSHGLAAPNLALATAMLRQIDAAIRAKG